MLHVSKERDVKHGVGFSEEPRSNKKPKIELGFSKQVAYILSCSWKFFSARFQLRKIQIAAFKKQLGDRGVAFSGFNHDTFQNALDINLTISV